MIYMSKPIAHTNFDGDVLHIVPIDSRPPKKHVGKIRVVDGEVLQIKNTVFIIECDRRNIIVTAINGAIHTDTILWEGNDYHNQIQVNDCYYDLDASPLCMERHGEYERIKTSSMFINIFEL